MVSARFKWRLAPPAFPALPPVLIGQSGAERGSQGWVCGQQMAQKHSWLCWWLPCHSLPPSLQATPG